MFDSIVVVTLTDNITNPKKRKERQGTVPGGVKQPLSLSLDRWDVDFSVVFVERMGGTNKSQAKQQCGKKKTTEGKARKKKAESFLLLV